MNLNSLIYSDESKNIIPGYRIAAACKFIIQLIFILPEYQQVIIMAYLLPLHLFLGQVRRSLHPVLEEVHERVALQGGKILKLLVVYRSHTHAVKKVKTRL